MSIKSASVQVFSLSVAPPHPFHTMLSPSDWHCTTCDRAINAIDKISHLAGKPHKRRVNSALHWTCTTCERTMAADSKSSHLAGKPHAEALAKASPWAKARYVTHIFTITKIFPTFPKVSTVTIEKSLPLPNLPHSRHRLVAPQPIPHTLSRTRCTV